MSRRESAQELREKAQHYRNLAAQAEDRVLQSQLLDIAHGFMELAEQYRAAVRETRDPAVRRRWEAFVAEYLRLASEAADGVAVGAARVHSSLEHPEPGAVRVVA